MTQSSDSNSIEPGLPTPYSVALDLLGLADGELDAVGQARVQQYLLDHPQADSHVMASLLLKQQIHTTMMAGTPAPSQALKDQITQLLAETAPVPTLVTPAALSSRSPARPLPSLGFWNLAWRWAPAGAAAMLLLGLLLTAWNQTHRSGPSGTPQVLTASMEAPVAYAQLSSDRIAAFSKRHTMCSRKLEQLYRYSEFPKQLGQMPKAIADCIGKMPRCSLDLSRVGYEFKQAGECHVPGNKSVHLVYRAKVSGIKPTDIQPKATQPDAAATGDASNDGPPADDSLSLWVVTYAGRPQIDEGILYQGDPANAEHPIFFWRQDDLVYYLVGNSFGHTRKAAVNLAMASR